MRLPAQNPLGLRNIGLSKLRIVHWQRLKFDFHSFAKARLNLLRKLKDGHLSRITQVDRITFVRLTQAQQAIDQVGHEAETACLRTVAKDTER
jgi:hypothetical protein